MMTAMEPLAPLSSAAAAAGGQQLNNNPAQPPVLQSDMVMAVGGFSDKLKEAADAGAISESLAAHIKARFTNPMAAPANLSSVLTEQAAWATAANSTRPWAAVGSARNTVPLATLVKDSLRDSTMAGSDRADSGGVKLQQATVAAEFLDLLLMCDSGFNNSEINSENGVQQESKSIVGLHSTVAAFADSAATNLLGYLRTELSTDTNGYRSIITTLQGPPHSAANRHHPMGRPPLHDADRSSTPVAQHRGNNPVMLAAQCLYLLSRHFQMHAVFVRDAMALVETLLAHICNECKGRVVQLSRFRDTPDLAPLCSLTWLVVFSVVNAVTVWKKVRMSNGALATNALIRSDVATTLGECINRLQRKYDAMPQPQRREQQGLDGAPQPLLSRVVMTTQAAPVLLGPREAAPAEVGCVGGSQCGWLAVIEGFLSVLTLAEGCLLKTKGDDRGYDRALEAFLGNRAGATAMSAAGSNPLPLGAMHRGKVTKRMVQLAPSPSTLCIPLDYIYIVPYEILSFLFDDMLPLLRYVADLEVASYRRYINDLQLLEEGPPQRMQSMVGAAAVTAEELRTGGGLAQRSMLEFFTSEMSHLLESLATCLEHLSPAVLNPDLDVDCAATFFIFKNCVRHMSEAFKIQRGDASTTWEAFALKLVTKFLDVLCRIGRNPQYLPRVVAMLTGAQKDCPEMQWVNLVRQALTCAGLTPADGVASTGTGTGASGAVSFFDATATEHLRFQASYSGVRYAKDAELVNQVSESHPHRQFTLPYMRLCQQRYMASFFLLLRQMLAHPALCKTVGEHVTLDLALRFLFAPQLSQSMLGSTLSLISTLVTDPADAAKVWGFLEEHKLLLPPHFSAKAPPPNSARSIGPSAHEPSRQEHASSFLGHCQYESTQGVYHITTGFLNLITTLFRVDTPRIGSFSTYASVTHFIAQDVLCGVSRRVFADEKERYTVTALGAAALRQALQVCFVPSGDGTDDDAAVLSGSAAAAAPTTAPHSAVTIPFATVMSTVRSPNDVIGEVLHVIFQGSVAPHELTDYQRSAVRQCVELLTAAIRSCRQQRLEYFPFDSRVTESATLAYHVLFLCGTNDPRLLWSTMQFLLLLPRSVMQQACTYWFANAPSLANVVGLFADLLHPNSRARDDVVMRASPELALLDDIDRGLAWMADGAATGQQLLEANRSLLLDLLIAQVTPNTGPSLTSWLCGFFTVSDPNEEAAGSAVGSRVLVSLVAGATSRRVEQANVAAAVKYVQLLYLLRANRFYGATMQSQLVELGGQSLFLDLRSFHPDRCAPLLLSKYAFVLKLLSLEVYHAHRLSPEQLNVHCSAIPDIPVEVLLSLLCPSHPGDEMTAEVLSPTQATTRRSHSDTLVWSAGSLKKASSDRALTLSCEASTDIAQWLFQILHCLPPFPSLNPLYSNEPFLAPAADGVVQYNIPQLYEALQRERASQQLPALTVEPMREKLQPYVEANAIFVEYVSVVNFVEGWCQVLKVACTLIRGLELSRVENFILCLLKGVDATATLTQAAHEQIVGHLFNCLVCVTAQLKVRFEEEAAATAADLAQGSVALTSATGLYDSFAGVVDTRRCRNSIRNGNTTTLSAVAPSQDNGSGTATVPPLSLISVARVPGDSSSRRRPREAPAAAAVFQSGPSAPPGLFTTAAGDLSNRCSAARRSRLARSLLLQKSSYADWLTVENSAGLLTLCARIQRLLRPMVLTSVRWATRVPAVRSDIFKALLCLTSISGMTVDDVAVYRAQSTLFDLLAADICTPSSAEAHQHALTLLVHLLGSSPALCDSFCSPVSSSGLGPLPLRCARSLIERVDAALLEFTDGGDMGVLLWLIQATFDYLSIISLTHATHVLQAHLVQSCLLMECWTRTAQVVFGHVGSGDPAGETLLHQSREVMKQLLLCATRWFNLLFATLSDVPAFAAQMQEFVRLQRQLIEYVFSHPVLVAARKSAASGSSVGAAGSSGLWKLRPISITTLTLYAELSELLRGLSTTYLAEECRALMGDLALPDLLLAFFNPSFQVHLVGEQDRSNLLSPSIAGAAATAPQVLTGGPMAATRCEEILARLVRNLAHFLLRAEYGLRGVNSSSLPSPWPQATQPRINDVYPLPSRSMLRESPHHISCILQATSHVAALIESWGNASNAGSTLADVSCSSRESYFLTLHALVCLLHLFAVPLPAAGPASTTASFANYLQALPLEVIRDVLNRCHTAVYALHDLSTDFCRCQSMGYGGGAITASPFANALAIEHAGASHTAAGPKTLPQLQAPGTPPFAPQEGSTPLTQGVTHQRSIPVGCTQQLRNGKDDSSFYNTISFLDGGKPADRAGALTRPKEATPTSPQTTIGELLQASSGNTARMKITKFNQAEDCPDRGVGRNSTSSGCFDSEHDIFFLESFLCQLKIAIANAIRAVQSAMELVHKP